VQPIRANHASSGQLYIVCHNPETIRALDKNEHVKFFRMSSGFVTNQHALESVKDLHLGMRRSTIESQSFKSWTRQKTANYSAAVDA
jgi:hypothetical protein